MNALMQVYNRQVLAVTGLQITEGRTDVAGNLGKAHDKIVVS